MGSRFSKARVASSGEDAGPTRSGLADSGEAGPEAQQQIAALSAQLAAKEQECRELQSSLQSSRDAANAASHPAPAAASPQQASSSTMPDTLTSSSEITAAEAGAEGGNSKFALEDDADLPEAAFGGIEDFHGGLQERLEGLPHHDILKAIRAEHCDSEDSHDEFTTPNYNITTTPSAEFEVVTDKAKGQAASKGERKVLHFDDLADDPTVKKAKLTEAELLALILYTGPMYLKYNAVLRQFPKRVLTSNKGNKYLNTITAVVSGIKKLAAIAPIPPGRIVWRGMSGRRMPKKFTEADDRGVCGGCEFGLMSTTTNLATALQYTKGKRRPTVFRIAVSAVNIGASLQFCSQYQGEAEILFTPFSFIEVVGQPEPACINGTWVEVIPVEISANLRSETVEEISARRRIMHCSNADFLKLEVFRDLNDMAASETLLLRLQPDLTAQYEARKRDDPGGVQAGLKKVGGELIETCKQDFADMVASQKAHGDAYYNDDEQFKMAVSDLLEKKRTAMSKVQLYLQDPSLYCSIVKEMSLQAVRKKVLGKLRKDISAAERGSDLEAKREAALGLCKETARLVADVEEVSEEATPLMRAVLKSDASGVRLLIAAGADPSREVGGQTALSLAAACGDGECAAALAGGGAQVDQRIGGMTALHLAAAEGHVEACSALIAAKADVGAVDERGCHTALHRAALGGHVEACSALIAAKADVGAVGQSGGTALHLAATGGHVEACSALIAAKADVGAVDESGGTALHGAAMGGQLEACSALIAAKADVGAVYKGGMTALHLAAAGGHVEACSALIAAKADVGAVDEGGGTALHAAALGGHVEACSALIAAKADVGAVNEDGMAALHLAAAGGHVEACSALIAAKADVGAVGQLGMTALEIATVAGRCDEETLAKLAALLG